MSINKEINMIARARRSGKIGAGIRKREARPFFASDPVEENEREAMRLLDLIVAEFESDPDSVKCFDARTVSAACAVIARQRNFERRGEIPPRLTEGRKAKS